MICYIAPIKSRRINTIESRKNHAIVPNPERKRNHPISLKNPIFSSLPIQRRIHQIAHADIASDIISIKSNEELDALIVRANTESTFNIKIKKLRYNLYIFYILKTS